MFAGCCTADTIAVESPTFFSLLQLIQDLGMSALEIPTHPQEGVDLESLEKALKLNPVRACLFISNFQNPLGCLISDKNKQRLVGFLNGKRIPIIEDDIYGDLNFEEPRPTTLKFFDRRGMVLYCSSFSKTLAPGLRVGFMLWVQLPNKVNSRDVFREALEANISIVGNILPRFFLHDNNAPCLLTKSESKP